jgi:hypothetical protein
MRQPFRWLCGELNGNYYQFLQNVCNTFIAPFMQDIAIKKATVFKLDDDDIESGEYPILPEDLNGIAKVAGVFPPYVTAESTAGCIVGSSSYKVGGVEYSERGLFNLDEERFNYVSTSTSVYGSDITTLANSRLRSSMVPDGAPILGYIEEGTTVFNEDGISVIPSAILPSPPVGKAYIAYYGEKYLFAAETFIISAVVDDATFKKIYESLMRIRSSHPSIYELSFLTTLLLDDYVHNMYIERSGNRFILHYTLNEESRLKSKVRMLTVWKSTIQKKYKLLTFQEDGGI